MFTNRTKHLLRSGVVCGILCWAPSIIAQGALPPPGLAYIGTLDKKLLVYDENKEDVIGDIPLQGIPRQTALSRDQTKLVILTTDMAVETVDLQAQKMTSHFELADGRSRPRMSRGGGGLVLDPTGRYLYATFRPSVKEVDYYRMDPPQFVKIDLQTGKVVQSFSFPPEMDQGFGAGVTYKVSPDGKSLYVFDEDVIIYDLATFKEVDRIEMTRPEYPGASPYRLAPESDPNAPDNIYTSLFTAVDPIVHKGTLGLATLDYKGRSNNRPRNAG
jgi:DNA-binding beta-propeller fold protein YncE